MLSYRHAFHAGNHADVIKHLVLVNTIQYLLKKESPLLYIDTHSGAGLYRTQSEESEKTQEFNNGYGKLDFSVLPPNCQAYFDVINPFREQSLYPGSPLIAAKLLRAQDKLRLFELHPSDFNLLKQNLRAYPAKIEKHDGLQGLKAFVPVQKQRTLILIDPSYEIKSDYKEVTTAVIQAYQRMPGATFLIWYPVVDRHNIDQMLQSYRRSKVRDLWQFELAIEKDNRERGMTASGILAINPPWTLANEMREALPAIQKLLSPQQGTVMVQNLIEE